MQANIQIKQTSKWQLVAISNDSYKDGSVYFTATVISSFKDLAKEYMVVVYKKDYNGYLTITKTDNDKKATKIYNQRYNTLSTSHSCIITTANDNDSIKKVQGRNSYRLWAQDGDLLLVSPKGVYL